MKLHDIPLKKKTWTDKVFRRLRKHVDFEISTLVLVVAEVSSITYYKALYQATNSRLLKRRCLNILREELMHLIYESSLLNHLSQKKSAPVKVFKAIFHKSLYLCTLLAVWMAHHRFYKGAGYGFLKFFKSNMYWFNIYFKRNISH